MQSKIKKITFVAVLLIGALFLGFNYFYQSQDLPQQAKAQASSDPLKGWAWSAEEAGDGGIGWVSFNSEDCDTNTNGFLDIGVCGGNDTTTVIPNYRVEYQSSGNLSGYAWSSNIGWIKFDPTTSAPGSASVNAVPEDPNQSVQIDAGAGLVSGWARACNVFQSGCSGALKDNTERGGWDGWIKMSSSSIIGSVDYGVRYNSITRVLSGFAWGGDVIGWLNFYNVGVGSLSTPQCSDGADNDSDGAIDMADPGCSNPNDNDETDLVSTPQCSDVTDNDGDSLTDYPDDPGCSNPNDNDETDILGGTCSDVIDNDVDCLTDGADPDCGSGTFENNFNAGFCPASVSCSSFSASPVSVQPSGTSLLSWQCQNANVCLINAKDVNGDNIPGQISGPVCNTSGCNSDFATTNPITKKTIFTLTCNGTGGSSIDRDATVNIDFDPTRCEINPRTGILVCP